MLDFLASSWDEIAAVLIALATFIGQIVKIFPTGG